VEVLGGGDMLSLGGSPWGRGYAEFGWKSMGEGEVGQLGRDYAEFGLVC